MDFKEAHSTISNIIAAAQQRMEVHNMLDRLEDGNLGEWISLDEKHSVESIRASLAQALKGTPQSAPAPAPKAAPAPVESAGEETEETDDPEMTAEERQSFSQNFWTLPRWGKDAVIATPKHDRDTKIMDIQNAIRAMGKEAARRIFVGSPNAADEPPTPKPTRSDQRRAALAAEMVKEAA